MGQCCNSSHIYSDNEYENIFRDIINSFPRISYKEIKNHLSKLQVISDEDSHYSEEKYIQFRKSLLPKSTKYPTIHKEMIPSWELAWQLAYKENLISNLLVWIFSFLRDEELNRYEILLEILAPTESYFDTSAFLEFLWLYLNVNLIHISNLILKYIVTVAKISNKKEFENLKITSELLLEMEQLCTKLSNKLNFKRFKQSLEIEVTRVYMKHSEYDRSNNRLEGAFTKQMFLEFSKEFNFLWNPLLLRIQYYNFIIELVSVSNA
jgi:hypothetical protein